MKLTITGLIPSTDYNIAVRASKGAVKSPWSPLFSFTTVKDTTIPAVPTNITWDSIGDSFHAEWSPVTENMNNKPVTIDRYELELTASDGTVGHASVPGATGAAITYDLSFSDNISMFGTAEGSISLRIRAVDIKGLKSGWSDPVLASNPIPDPPTNVVVTPGTDALMISWDAPTGDNSLDVEMYNIYVGNSAGFIPTSFSRIFHGNALSFTYTTATYSEQFFKIRSVDKFNQESLDATGSGTAISPFLVDVTAPAVPTNLSATITNYATGISSYANVSWSPPSDSDLAGYTLRYRVAGSTDIWTVISLDKSATSTRAELAQAYKNYEFQIRAYDWQSNYSSYTTLFTAISPANLAPANVTGLTSVAGKDSITYSWTPVADQDIKNYEVTFSTSSSFASGNITYLTGTSASLTVGGLSYGTTYYARVRAVDTGGLVSPAWSATNTSATGVIAAAAPTDGYPPASSPTPTVTSGLGYLYATWSPVAINSNGGSQIDPVTYEVHLSTTNGFSPSTSTKLTELSGTFALIDVLPGTSTALTYGTTYYVKLIAKDRDGAAAASAQASGVPTKLTAGDSSLTANDVGAPTTAQFNTLSGTVNSSIKSSVNEYAVNSSETTPPDPATGGWSTATPTRTAGTFIWFRTKITYNDNTTSTTNPALLTGNTGSAGAPGVGVSSTSVTYQASTSGDTAPTGTWSSSIPSVPAGQYLWTKTVTTYTDNSTTTAYSVAAQGANGTTGRGISSTTVTYQISTSGTVTPTGTWSSTVPSVPAGQYLWTKTVYNYTDSTSDTAYSVSYAGTNGSNGTSATYVSIGNDAVAIPVSSTGAALSAGSITIPFSGWVGATRTAATMAIGTLPAGITLGSNTAATASADGTVVLNYASGAVIGAADTGNITLTATCNGQPFTQYFSWTRAYQGAAGGAGTSATSLDKTPDNFIVPTDASGNATSTGSVVVTLKGLVGATASNVTIGTAPALPAGITATPSGSGTTSAAITFNWTSGANIGGSASSGVFTWPITVNGITFSTNFGWARALAGAPGSAGTAGKGVSSITPYFAQVTTGSIPADPSGATPAAPWTTAEPAYATNTELWRSEKVLYTDATFAYTAKQKVSSYSGVATAITAANGKNSIIISTSTASGTTNPTNGAALATGDFWYQKDAQERIIAQWEWTGSAWLSKTLNDTVIANISAGKLITGSTFTNDLNVKSNFTLGDATTAGVIKSYNYSSVNKTGFSLSSAGLDIQSGQINAAVLAAGTTITNNLGVTGILTISSTGAIQSSNYNGTTTGWKISSTGITMLDAGSTVKADAIEAGTLGGSAGSGVINVGAGTSLVLNGGYLKSNTYTGTAYNAGATAGFYLGNDGLVITQGAIKANALVSDTLTSTTITLGAGGVIQAGTWSLSSSGLSIPNGGIQAASLNINLGGENLLLDSSFENINNPYRGPASSNIEVTYATGVDSLDGGRSLAIRRSGTGDSFYVTTYHLPMAQMSGQRVMVSWWWKSTESESPQSVPAIQTSNNSQYYTVTVVSGPYPPTSTWSKVVSYVDIPAGLTLDARLVLRPSSTSTTNIIYYDHIKVEVGNVSTAYSSSSTSIDGGQIKTGSIQSNTLVTVNGNSVPAWSINTGGYASFAGAQILGNTVLGSAATDTSSRIQSYNYTPGSTGWMIRADGTAELDAASLRGSLTIGQVTNLQSTLDAKETPSGAQTKANTAQTNAQNYAYNTYDGTRVTLNGWKYGSTTYINGGQIYSNTITANQINSGSIMSYHIDTYALDSRTIRSVNITGSTLSTASNGYSYININQNSIAMYNSSGSAQYGLINLYDNLTNLDIKTFYNTNLTLTAGNAIYMNAPGGVSIQPTGAVTVGAQTGGAVTIYGGGAISLEPPSGYVIRSARTYSGGTTSGTALVINSNGQIMKTSSLEEYKLVIEDLTTEQIKPMLEIQPKTWFDRYNMERMARYLHLKEKGIATEEDLDGAGTPIRIPGAVAEEVSEIFPLIGNWNLEGKLDGIQYEKIGVLLIPLVRELYEELAEMKEEIKSLRETR